MEARSNHKFAQDCTLHTSGSKEETHPIYALVIGSVFTTQHSITCAQRTGKVCYSIFQTESSQSILTGRTQRICILEEGMHLRSKQWSCWLHHIEPWLLSSRIGKVRYQFGIQFAASFVRVRRFCCINYKCNLIFGRISGWTMKGVQTKWNRNALYVVFVVSNRKNIGVTSLLNMDNT